MRPGAHAAAGGARGGGVDRVRGLRGRRRRRSARSSPALGFRADRAASLEGGDALARRARSTSSSTPSPRASRIRTRSCTGRRWWRSGSGSATRRRRWTAPRRCACRPSASRSGRASSTSRRSAASAARSIYFTDAASELGRVWEIEFEPTGDARRRAADADRPRRAVDEPGRDAELAALVPVALRLRDHAAGRRGRPGGDRREHGAAGPGPGAPDLPERQRLASGR